MYSILLMGFSLGYAYVVTYILSIGNAYFVQMVYLQFFLTRSKNSFIYLQNGFVSYFKVTI